MQMSQSNKYVQYIKNIHFPQLSGIVFENEISRNVVDAKYEKYLNIKFIDGKNIAKLIFYESGNISLSYVKPGSNSRTIIDCTKISYYENTRKYYIIEDDEFSDSYTEISNDKIPLMFRKVKKISKSVYDKLDYGVKNWIFVEKFEDTKISENK